MSSIGGTPPPVFQTVPTHSPLGKPTVGIEAADAPLPPVEASTAADELRHRDVLAKPRDDEGRGRDSREQQQEQESESEANAREMLEGQLVLTAQTAPIEPLPAAYQARHLAEFETRRLPPGSLLDQQV